MGQNSILSSFFAQRAKKASAESWKPPQELEVGPHSGTYLLVVVVLRIHFAAGWFRPPISFISYSYVDISNSKAPKNTQLCSSIWRRQMFGGAFENLLISLSFYGASIEEIMLKARPGPPWGAGGSRHCGQRNRMGIVAPVVILRPWLSQGTQDSLSIWPLSRFSLYGL